MAHPLSRLKLSHPLWRIEWDADGALVGRRIFPPGEGWTLSAWTVDDLAKELAAAETYLATYGHPRSLPPRKHQPPACFHYDPPSSRTGGRLVTTRADRARNGGGGLGGEKHQPPR